MSEDIVPMPMSRPGHQRQPGQAGHGDAARHADEQGREGRAATETGQRHDVGQPIAHHQQQQGTRGAAGGRFLGWWVWLFIHIGFLTGYRNRVGAVLGWWFAFTRDLRRERAFTLDDTPVPSGVYGESFGEDPAGGTG
jgi:hypothetical protein